MLIHLRSFPRRSFNTTFIELGRLSLPLASFIDTFVPSVHLRMVLILAHANIAWTEITTTNFRGVAAYRYPSSIESGSASVTSTHLTSTNSLNFGSSSTRLLPSRRLTDRSDPFGLRVVFWKIYPLWDDCWTLSVHERLASNMCKQNRLGRLCHNHQL